MWVVWLYFRSIFLPYRYTEIQPRAERLGQKFFHLRRCEYVIALAGW